LTDPIPQASPGAAIQERRDEYVAAAARVLDSGRFVLSTEVDSFEREFGDYLGARWCVGVANGTDAVEIALRAVGIKAGDGVITVAHTAGATAAAIIRIGAVPIFVDVVASTFTMDPAQVERVASGMKGAPEPRAIVPVHLYGAMADMTSLLAIARAHGLRVVEDCAQAHGARLKGRPAGCWGDVAAFSFYPTKNLGAIGDGGAVVTDDEGIAEISREIREYGWRTRQVSQRTGVNSRLDEIQAAFLRVGLSYLDIDNARRVSIAADYDAGLTRSSLSLPERLPDQEPVFHQYVVQSDRRDEFRAWCSDREVGTAIHYPVPLHRQPGFHATAVTAGLLAVTDRLASEIVSLPMYPQLSRDHVQRVISVAAAWSPDAS
jgi:dTDP-4-amino-4,6-dideoxygalactose transaminase